MFSALIYLQYRSIVNRTVMRIKRLKQPKYLLGAIVGGLYFYFYFFKYLFGFGGPRRGVPLSGGGGNLFFFETLGAAVLFVLVLAGWIFPRDRAALAFSEAEVAFLFPAPISRKGLIHYKLLRSQVAIMFTTFFLVLVSNRFGGKVWIHALGWWCILSTLNLHLLAASFARTKLFDRGITNWQRRTAILLVLGMAAGAAIWWTKRALPEFHFENVRGPEDLKDFATTALESGPLPWLLFPFRMVVRPYFALSATAFLSALAPVAVLLIAHYLWVVHANVAFEEASVDASRKLAEKIASMRAGHLQPRTQLRKSRRDPFRLRPIGPPATALLWKNLLSAGQAFSARFWILIAAVGLAMSIAVSQAAGKAGLVTAAGIMAGAFIPWLLLLGPQLLRQDFRQDLAVIEVLKTYPLKGWQIALGELLAPASILTGAEWLLILISLSLLTQSPIPDLGRPELFSVALSLAIVLPILNLITLQIPNAAVLVFPAWFQTGKDAPHGIEATGQRIIFMLGQLLVFVVALIPAAVAFGLVFLLFRVVVVFALPAVIPVAAVAATVVLAAEAAFGILLLGRAFERFDVGELPPA